MPCESATVPAAVSPARRSEVIGPLAGGVSDVRVYCCDTLLPLVLRDWEGVAAGTSQKTSLCLPDERTVRMICVCGERSFRKRPARHLFGGLIT